MWVPVQLAMEKSGRVLREGEVVRADRAWRRATVLACGINTSGCAPWDTPSLKNYGVSDLLT